MAEPSFDVAKAHAFFSADCFNNAWGLIGKADRSPEEDEAMLLLAMASVWHWTEREDHTPTNLSIGFWQVSRVHALSRRADEARRYAQLALDAANEGEADAFTIGYAHEALARAEGLAGNEARRDEHLAAAREAAAEVTDEESKKWLVDDLETIG